MQLHEEDISLLEYEFNVLRPVAGALARTLDARLFATDPSLRLLFDLPISSSGGSGRRLTAGMQAVFSSFRRPQVLLPLLRSYGVRCVGRGVRERDYRALAAVIIASVADVLEDDFDDASRQAWGNLADELMAIMIDGARASLAAAVAI